MSHRKHRLPPASSAAAAAPVQDQADQAGVSATKPVGSMGQAGGAGVPGTQAAAPASLDTLLAFTWKVHDYTSELIRFADTKASIVLALASGILSILFGAKIHNPCIKTWFAPPGPGWPDLLLGGGALLALGLLGTAIAIAGSTIVPRLSKTKTTSFTFWHGILQHGDPKVYACHLLPLTQDHIIQSVAEEVFTLASICQKKYQHVRWSIWLAAVGAAVGCVVFLFSS